MLFEAPLQGDMLACDSALKSGAQINALDSVSGQTKMLSLAAAHYHNRLKP